jgi:hypothetical protein
MMNFLMIENRILRRYCAVIKALVVDDNIPPSEDFLDFMGGLEMILPVKGGTKARSMRWKYEELEGKKVFIAKKASHWGGWFMQLKKAPEADRLVVEVDMIGASDSE